MPRSVHSKNVFAGVSEKLIKSLILLYGVIVLSVILFVSSCSQSTTIVDQTLTPTNTLTPDFTPFSLPTPTATYLPITPAYPGTQAPDYNAVISPENADRLTLFARWGNGNATQAQYTSNGKYLIVASSTGIYFYNAKDYSLAKYMDLGVSIVALALTQNGMKMAAASLDKVFIFEQDSSEPTSIINAMVSSLVFSPNGQILALGTYKLRDDRRATFGTIQLWDAISGKEILDFKNDSDWIHSMVFSPNGKFLATAGYATKIWNLNGKLLDTHGNYVSGGSTKSLSFSHDGMLLAEGADTEHIIHVWRVLNNGRLVIFRTIVGHGSEVVVSPDGNWLAVDTRDGLFVWQLSTGVLKQKLSENRTNYDSIAWSPDSKNIVTTSSVLGVEIWDMENGKFLQNLNKLTGAVTVLNWLPDGKTLVRDTDQGNIALIDSHRGDVLETFHGDALQSSFATSPDGNWLAIKSYFSSIHGVEIINFRDSAFHYVLPNSYGAGLTSESFSRDSRYLVTSGFDGSNQIIQVWKTKDWSLANFWVVGEITENLLFNTLIFNPDGQTVTMYRFRDTGIKAYRISDGSLIQTMETTPIAIIFPPDGKFLLSMTEQLNSSGDKSEQALSFWHVSNGSLAYKVEILPVHEIINLQPPYYHDLPSAIDFSPNGDLFAVGFPDGTVGVFRVSDRQLLQNLTGHTMRVTSVSFSQDGRSLVSGSLDGTIRLWGIK